MEQKKDNTNRGYLYPNQNKTKATQPDFTGVGNFEGKNFRLAGWETKNSEGKKYISLSITEMINNPKPNDNKAHNDNGNKDNGNNSSGSSQSSSDDDELSRILNSDDSIF